MVDSEPVFEKGSLLVKLPLKFPDLLLHFLVTYFPLRGLFPDGEKLLCFLTTGIKFVAESC